MKWFTEEKIKKIHDYIIDSTKYDTLKTDNIHDETYKSNTAYGVLIQGYGICSGYSDTISIFLNELGINPKEVVWEDLGTDETGVFNRVFIYSL